MNRPLTFALLFFACAASACGSKDDCHDRCLNSNLGAFLASEGFETDGLDAESVCDDDAILNAGNCEECRDAIIDRFRLTPDEEAFCEGEFFIKGGD